jgi:acyl-CoA thioester hydrolase
MNSFNCNIEVRWSDLDPNFHVRHSAYYDYGAYVRIQFLTRYHITAQFMLEHGFGLIVFREECVFKKEIRLEDRVRVDLKLIQARRDFSRWTLQHHIFKNDEILAAVITLEGAWMDTVNRKLMVPPEAVFHCFELAPRAENFNWIEI